MDMQRAGLPVDFRIVKRFVLAAQCPEGVFRYQRNGFFGCFDRWEMVGDGWRESVSAGVLCEGCFVVFMVYSLKAMHLSGVSG